VVPVTVTAVAAGEEHSLALGADGTVWTCGVVLKSRHKNPVKVSGSSRSSPLRPEAGSAWRCAPTARCGVGGQRQRSARGRHEKAAEKPVRVEGLNNIVAIAAGVTHVLALDVGGNVWAWGFNTTGQLGDGTVKSRPTPGLVHNLDRVIAIAAGGAHSLGCKRPRSGRTWRRLEAVIIHITGQGSGGRWSALRGQGGCWRVS